MVDQLPEEEFIQGAIQKLFVPDPKGRVVFTERIHEWMNEWLQDEMIELGEKEAIEAVADKEAAETAAHVVLMKEANLEVRPFSSSCSWHMHGNLN